MDGIIAGVLFGGVASAAVTGGLRFAQDIWAAQRLQKVASDELAASATLIEEKMEWLVRDVTNKGARSIPSEDTKLMVGGCKTSTDTTNLFLGEAETLSLPLVFWDAHVHELARGYWATFAVLSCRVNLIRQFEVKFRQMKLTFDYPDPCEMARACFHDLVEIRNKLLACPTL